MTDQILRAYYDLAVAPPTFDICVFLYAAEMERKFLGLDAFDLIVVANDGDGFRKDLNLHDSPENTWRLNHIVLPAHRLAPGCRRVVFIPDRREAIRDFKPNSAVFPPDYEVEAPTSRYLDSNILMSFYRDRPAATLCAPAPALKRLARWLAQHTGNRRAVTITLRNNASQPKRNSNLPEWIKFAEELDPERYVPVFVRDTKDLFAKLDPRLHNFLLCDPAAQDIELRLALYELSHVNLFVDSGPAVCCMLDEKTRCIRLNLNPTHNSHAGIQTFLRRGYNEGMQWAGTHSYQRSVWAEDTATNITDHFFEMENDLRGEVRPTPTPLPPATTIISNFIAGDNHEDAISLASLALEKHPDDIEARYLRGLALMGSREIDSAYADFSVLYSNSTLRGTVLLPLAKCLWKRGQSKEAINLLIGAAQTTDDARSLRSIADALLTLGENEAGFRIISKIKERFPDDISLLHLEANYLANENLSSIDAISIYEKIILLQPDNSTPHLRIADCYARSADYKKALLHANKAIQIDGKASLATLVNAGRWWRYLQEPSKSRVLFSQALEEVNLALDPNISTKYQIDNFLSIKAHITTLLGDKDTASSCYEAMLDIFGREKEFQYDPEFYLNNTSERIARLREIIAGRDVFIFCHGPSISKLDENWEKFAKFHTCLMAVNRFKVFENGFLVRTGSKLDIVMVTHFVAFRQMFDEITEWLTRDVKNMLVTSRWATERLGARSPSGRSFEAMFDDKLVYYGEGSPIEPATPYHPFRFLSGNTLTLLIIFAVIGRARRIFLFGADGAAPLDQETSTHYGAEKPEFRFEISDNYRRRIGNALAADTFSFPDNVETGLIAAEHLFDLKRPPIYNVSPDSAIECFPRISYEEALAMLGGGQDTALGSRTALPA